MVTCFTRLHQIQDGSDGSKSVNDIHVDPSVIRQIRYEELQKYREQIKSSEDKWQDDLTKWKNRRKSVNSDIVKKKEEREKTEQITYSGKRNSKTFKEIQEDREYRKNTSVGSRLKSLSFLDDEDVFEKPVTSPRTSIFATRSYTIDTPYSSDPSVPTLTEEEPPLASTAAGQAASPPPTQELDTVDIPAGSDATTTITSTAITTTSHSPLHAPTSPKPAPLERNTSPVPQFTNTAKREETSTAVSTTRSEQTLPLVDTQTEVEAPSSGSLSYQRSDSARLSSVVTPRPFGTQSTRITSLPRAYTMDESHKRINGSAEVSKKSSVPSRYHQFMTYEDEANSSSAHSSEDEEEEEEEGNTGKSITSSQSSSIVLPQVKSEVPAVNPAPARDTSQENYCEMRISLNQKPNSSRDFGFQTDWDSTGAHVKSIQPGSPAEMCQLQPGDEVLMVNGHKVAEMSYTDWKSCMEEALQEGSLVMDIKRQGKNNWGRNQPSLPFKSHKTINLTSMDHPILLGSHDANTINSSLDFTSRTSTESLKTNDVPTHSVIDVATNGINGDFRSESVTMRNKESEPISLKNLKRRSEFFEQGGSESAISDIPVPSITPSSSHWSWNPEEERRRQEKWQKEQERLLQEKYKRDQEKLQEEWRKAQQELAKSVDQQEQPGSLDLNSHSINPRSPLSPLRQPTPLWQDREEEERKQKEERQRQAEERRKREEEERELQRLQEERKRKDKQEEEERKRRDEEELRWQRKREEEREEERRRQEAAEQQRREREKSFQQQKQQWAAESHSFANAQPPLSFTDRTKSKSSPQLDEEVKAESKGVYMQPGGMAHWLLEEQMRSSCDKQAQSQRAASELEMERRNILNAMRYREPERVTGSRVGEASWRDAQRKGLQPTSKVEVERQQILNEMKKKTQLLTDSSWIRQRAASATTSKEPEGPLMRRGESLDNLDASHNSWRSSWTPRSNSYIPNYSRPHSALSGNTSFYGGGGGAGIPSSPWSQQSHSSSLSSPSPTTSPEPTSEAGAPHQRSRSVSGKKICTFCDSPLGKGAAMIIESLGLCYHLGCFKCIDCKSDLGGSEAGAEVRIQNKQLYCNTCYMRFKFGQPTSM
ncbi:hypothetical protein LDENG_00030280 [Lucifuga dentata]|nr:hypothetical protein LDENG_00030280 [Lucifuga dentata]